MDIPALFQLRRTLLTAATLPSCRQHPRKRLLAALLLCLSLGTQATVISFDLGSVEAGQGLDNLNKGNLTQGALVASFTSFTSDFTDSVFNQTATRFGINSLDTAADSASLIDAVNDISESLSVSFSENVLLKSIVLSVFAPGEQAMVIINSGPPILLLAMSSSLDSYSFSNQPINAGDALTIAHSLGNGFSLDSISVELVSVTEPSSLALMLVAGLIFTISTMATRGRMNLPGSKAV